MATTRRVVVNAVVEVCGTDEGRLIDNATLQDLAIDSLDLLEVAMIVEEELGVVVEAEDFEDVETLGQTVAVFSQLQPTVVDD